MEKNYKKIVHFDDVDVFVGELGLTIEDLDDETKVGEAVYDFLIENDADDIEIGDELLGLDGEEEGKIAHFDDLEDFIDQLGLTPEDFADEAKLQEVLTDFLIKNDIYDIEIGDELLGLHDEDLERVANLEDYQELFHRLKDFDLSREEVGENPEIHQIIFDFLYENDLPQIVIYDYCFVLEYEASVLDLAKMREDGVLDQFTSEVSLDEDLISVVPEDGDLFPEGFLPRDL